MRPQRCWGATGIFQHLWGFGLACTRAHGSCYNQSVRAVAYPNTVCAPCNLMLGRVPQFPLFLHGNTTPTIPHSLRSVKRSAFEHGTADAADPLGRRGSNVYEVNPWLWQFGRGKPRLGGLSVSATEDRREMMSSDRAKQAMATRSRRQAARGERWMNPVASVSVIG